jgi:hypothetical protein
VPVFALWPSGTEAGAVVWIDAESETQARRLLSANLHTHAAAMDRMAFYCVADDSHAPPPGVIVTDCGRTFPISLPVRSSARLHSQA